MLKYKKWVTETVSKVCGQLRCFSTTLSLMWAKLQNDEINVQSAIKLNHLKLDANDLENKVITGIR